MRLCNFNRIKLRDRYKEQDGKANRWHFHIVNQMVYIYFFHEAMRKYRSHFYHEEMPFIIFDTTNISRMKHEPGRRPRYNPGWHIKRRSSRTIDSHEAKRRAAAVNWKYVKDNKTISHKT